MDEETQEYRIRLYAHNRYEMRMIFKFRLNETDKDDWRVAEEQVQREEANKESHDI